jgi:pimeloyl-ACP methyl ester carboxylesterase
MSAADTGAQTVRAGDAAFSFLEAGSGPPLVLLHGIGSAAASFRYQLEALSARFRVVAWDSPGYGASTPLAIEHPDTSDYAAALDAWLGALGIDRCHLVGQSLGTLIAARFAAEQPRRVLSLTLAGVARGHGRLPPPERQRLLAQRLDDLAQLGPQGMAAKRGPRLLGPEATESMRRTVIEIMARIPAEGYAQAARMLSTGDITADLVRLSTALPIQIMVGQADVITPPESNLEIAAAIPAASVHVVPGAGHALYLEKPAEFNRLVSDFAATRSAG